MAYVIRATRSAASVMGAASSLLKRDGVVLILPDKETAEQEAAWYNSQLLTKNVHYQVEEQV